METFLPFLFTAAEEPRAKHQSAQGQGGQLETFFPKLQIFLVAIHSIRKLLAA